MHGLFRPEGLVIRFLTRVCDLLLLNALLLLACLTVVCAGAGLTALYTVTLRLMRGEDTGIVTGFLHALRDNFLPSTPATVLLFADITLLALLCNALFAPVIPPAVFVLLCLAAAFLTALLSYLFPLLARFEAGFPQQLLNAGKLALANLPVTFLLAAVNLLPLLMITLLPELWSMVVGLWALIGAAAGAYLNSFYLNRIFEKGRR